MRLYAKPSKLLFQQLIADLGTIGWVYLWWLIAKLVGRLIAAFAVPAQKAGELVGDLSGRLTTAAESVGEVPLVGNKLRSPLDDISTGLGSLQGYASSMVDSINMTAFVISIIVFAIPMIIWLWKWLPWRVSFIVQSKYAARLLLADDALELFALRAMSTTRFRDLARVTTTPMADWQSGDERLLRRLAALELSRHGLSLPRR